MADTAARKTTPKATDEKAADKSAEVEVINNDTDDTPEVKEKRDPELKDGVYIEYDVELSNGAKIEVGVIVDQRKLPATYGSLLAEGNGPALTIATMTTQTRRILDLMGATMEDLQGVLPAVIERARDAADAAEDK